MRIFEEFQAFVECKPHKLLKASQTRWLSLEACINRLLEQYDALLSYFRSTDECSATVRRITEGLEKPLTKAYLMFLSDGLPIINVFNKLMQQQSPTIHFLHQEVQSFVRKLLLRFMSTNSVQGVDISDIDFDCADNYKPLNEVFVGEKGKHYVENSVDLSVGDVKKFQETCRNFGLAAVKYAVKKLSLDNNGVIKNIRWIQPLLQDYNLNDQVLAILHS